MTVRALAPSVVLAAAIVATIPVTPCSANPVYSPVTSPGGSRLAGIFDVFPRNLPLRFAQSGEAFGNVSGFALPDSGPVRFSSDGTVTRLQRPTGLDSSDQPFLIDSNASGMSVGRSDLGVPSLPLRWDRAGNVTTLGVLSPQPTGSAHPIASANSINVAGLIVGSSSQAGDPVTPNGSFPVRWNPGSTTPVRLQTPTAGSAQAVYVNDAGVIAGRTTGGGNRPLRWDAGSDLAVELTSPVAATIYSLSNSGVTVGHGPAPAGTPGGSGNRAVRWDAGATAGTLLDAPGTNASGAAFAEAVDVDSAGTTVGRASVYDASNASLGTRAVRWAAGSTAVEVLALPTPATGSPTPLSSQALAMNDAGVIVGTSYGGTGFANQRAAYWLPDGTARDLNALLDPGSGWTLAEAYGISEDNWATGYGTYDPDGPGGVAAVGAVYLIPIPEPTSLAAVALGGLILRRRRS